MPIVTSETPQSALATARTESKTAPDTAADNPRRDAWRRYFRSERRRMRDAFTRARLISTLKTLIWVVPLTLLIWIYAEREQVAMLEGLSIPIDVTTTDASRIVTLVDPRDGIIRADVRGPRASLERLRRQIAARQGDPAIRIDIDSGLSTGREHELRVIGMLNSHPDFWNYGIAVRNSDPSNLRVFVDEIVEVDVPVRVPPGVENLASTPSFDPPVVTVRGPRQRIELADTEGELAVYANIASLPILDTPGQHDLASVHLTRSAPLRHLDVSVSPGTVRAVIHVRARDTEFLIRSMPVYAISPPGLLNDYRLEHEDSIANITVIGPPEQIELLPDYRPVALLELRPDDRPGEQRSRRVRIDLPTGVRLNEESARREVTFRLIERSATN